MKVHATLDSSTVNGPGRRGVLWFQGCDLGCSGCFNPETWDPAGGRIMTIRQVADWVRNLKDIDGLTFSGGEPMAQAMDLAAVIQVIAIQRPTLSLGMFTGYSERELESGAFRCGNHTSADKIWMWNTIRRRLDFAVCGRYNALKPCTDPLTTSSNQRLRFFSTRYTLADFAPQEIEVQIDTDGRSITTGFPILG